MCQERSIVEMSCNNYHVMSKNFLRPSAAFAASTVPLQIYVRYVRSQRYACQIESGATSITWVSFLPGLRFFGGAA